MKIAVHLFLILIFSATVQAQDKDPMFDYSAFPEIRMGLDHTMLNLNIDMNNGVIQGIVRYDFSSLQNDTKEIILHTSETEINAVRQGENALEFSISGDSLIIELKDTLQAGDRSQIHITFESASEFGIHRDAGSTVWTSLNPGAVHHWMPVFDHPETTSTVDAYITLPVGQNVFFNGLKKGDEIVSTDAKKVQFQSNGIIPLSQLSLVAGKFESEQAVSGVKKVNVVTPSGYKNDSEITELLNTSVSVLKTLENKFSFEYPYDFLHVVVLPDHFWDERQWGAGMVFVYENLGSLKDQVRRGILSQWIGSYHRSYEYSSDIRNMEYFKSVLIEGNSILNSGSGLRSIDSWNSFQGIESSEEDPFMRTYMQDTVSDLLKNLKGSLNWNDYAAFWYKGSGSYWTSVPEGDYSINTEKPENTEKELTASNEESADYEVDYLYDELNNRLKLVFRSVNEGENTLQDIGITQFGFSDTSRSNTMITGESDSISVDLISGIEYLVLENEGEQQLIFEENKPFFFLINQLRSSDKELRLQAAKQLKGYSENPDLQLAMNDALSSETDGEVRAALLSTLNNSTMGDSGTEQTFIEALNSGDLNIQIRAAEALSAYQGNSTVVNALKNMMIRTENDSLFNTALNSISVVGNSADLSSLARRFMSSDSTGNRTLKIIQKGVGADTTGNLSRMTFEYFSGSYPYKVRKRAIDIVMDNSIKPDNIKSQVRSMLADHDPRIRFYTAELSAMAGFTELLKERSKEEFDPRVKKKILELLTEK